MSFIGFYRVLKGFTEFYRVLIRFRRIHWVCTVFYRFLLGFTGFYRVVPGCTGFYLSLSYRRFPSHILGTPFPLSPRTVPVSFSSEQRRKKERKKSIEIACRRNRWRWSRPTRRR